MKAILCVSAVVVAGLPVGGAAQTAGCPAGPDQFELAITSEVTFDAAAGLYTYAYTLANFATSAQEVMHFELRADKPQDFLAPADWSVLAPPLYPDIVTWAAFGDVVDAPSPTGMARNTANLKPGETRSGFSLRSVNPPGTVSWLAYGFAPVSMEGMVDDESFDLESFLEDLEANCPPRRPKTGTTTGPVAPAAGRPNAPAPPTFGDISHDSVAVAWVQPDGPAPASYDVMRSVDEDGAPATWMFVERSVSGLSIADSDVASYTPYWYRVRGVNDAGGAGEWSAASFVRTTLGPPGTVAFPEVEARWVTVKWALTNGASMYHVEQAPDAAGIPGPWSVVADGVEGREVQDSVEPNLAYWYRVRASRNGVFGPYTAPTRVMTRPDYPGAPTFRDVADSTLTVQWTQPIGGADSYVVERGSSSSGPWEVAASNVVGLSFDDWGLEPSTAYYYRVIAVNSAGLSSPSSSSRVTTLPPPPSTAPGDPTFSNVSATSVTVTWTAASGATSYKLERAPDSGGAPGSWTEIGAPFGLSYTDASVSPNTACWYRVRGANGGSNGPYSAATGTVTAPGAPGAPSFAGVTSWTVAVSWTAPAGGAAAYDIERALATAGPWARVATGVVELTYLDAGLSPNTLYHYRVRGTNALGAAGAYSTTASVTTAVDSGTTPPGAPGAPTYSSVTVSSFVVGWSVAVGAGSYKLERAPDASGAPGTWTQIASGVTALTYFSSGLTANTAYWYRVRATNAGGDGPYSPASMTMTTPNAPAAPTFSAVGPYTVTVNWAAPAGEAASYKVERGTSSSGPWTQVASGVTTLSHTDAAVAANVTYWYRVRATNALGLDGSYSSSASVSTPLDPAVSLPGVPGMPTYTSVWTSYLYVNWAAAAGAVSYKVERAPDASGSPGTWTQIASGVTALTYLNSGLTANTAYWYRVRATNAGGDGPYSAASMTMTTPNAPGAPTFSAVGSYTVTVNWTAPTGGAASYKVERGTSSSGPWTQVASGVTTLSHTDATVAPNVAYWYRVAATNAVGLDGSSSSAASVSTSVDPAVSLPGTPGTPTYTYVSASGLYVNWTTAAGALSYKVERAPDASGAPGTWAQIASGVTTLTYSNFGLTANTAYWYRVRATNAGGDGPYSVASMTMTTPNAPAAPTFSAVGSYTVTVNWTAPTGGAASYKVERGTSSSGPWTQVASGVTALSYTDATVAPNVTYWYRVAATNAVGLDGSYSSTASVSIPADPAVSLPSASGTPTYTSVWTNYLYVNWTAAAGAVSYKLERAPDASGAPGTWAQIASGVTALTYLNSSGLTANTAYWYRVRATNAGGDGPYSTASIIMTLPNAPGAPVFSAVGPYTVTVNWTAPTGDAASYKVERGAALYGPFTQIAAGVTALAHVDNGVAANSTYYYRVRATNAVGLDGSYSSTASVSIPADPAVSVPSAPGTPTYASVWTNYLYVNWTAATGAVSYRVERAPDASGAPGTWAQIASGVTALTYLNSSGLTANTAYWYRVRATNAGGDGPYSTASIIMTLPNAPGAPAFSAVGPYTVTVNWTAPTGDAASYKVERGTALYGPFTQIAAGVTALAHVDNGVAANSTYYYRVRATNAVGLDGSYSSTASVSTPADPAVSLPGAPGTPTYTSVWTSYLYVNWTAATGAVSHRVERAPDASGAPGTWTEIASGVTALTYLNSSGLTANTDYWYRVRATNAGGDGPYSTASMIMTLPNAPGAPAFSAIGPYTVTVNWTAPAGGAASYKVERGTSSYGPFTQVAGGVTTLSYTDATVAANVTYWYRVRATNALGLDGSYSSAASVSTPVDPAVSLPGAPGTPTYTSVWTSYLYVNWTAATGAVSYRVERAPDASGAPGTWTEIASGVTALTYLNSGLTGNTAYWYRARATNAAGDGPYSAASQAMTTPNAPGAVAFSGVGSYTVTVNWTAPTGGAASYKVERGTSSYGPFTQVASGVTAPSYTDATVAPNVTYWYQVRATNALGLDGSSSSTASVSTPVDPAVSLPAEGTGTRLARINAIADSERTAGVP